MHERLVYEYATRHVRCEASGDTLHGASRAPRRQMSLAELSIVLVPSATWVQQAPRHAQYDALAGPQGLSRAPWGSVTHPAMVGAPNASRLYQARNVTYVHEWLHRYHRQRKLVAPQLLPSVSWAFDPDYDDRVKWIVERAPPLDVKRPLTAMTRSQNWRIHGCCPAATALDARFFGHRCCSDKWHRLLPLRPVGGMSMEQVFACRNRFSTHAPEHTKPWLALSLSSAFHAAILATHSHLSFCFLGSSRRACRRASWSS